MANKIVITHTTIVDRGHHDSEGASVRIDGQPVISLGITYAGHKEGYSYRAVLTYEGETHPLRYVQGIHSSAILTPEVNQISAALSQAGWHAHTERAQDTPAFGIQQAATTITLTPGPNTQDPHTVLAAVVAEMTAAAAKLLAAELVAKEQREAAATECTIRHQVIWNIVGGGWRFTAEHIYRQMPDEDEISLYKLGPMVQRGDQWQAYFSKHDGFKDQIIDNNYALASIGGDRPTRDDPPVVHLKTEIDTVLAEMTARGWQQVGRAEEETENNYSRFYTITYTLGR